MVFYGYKSVLLSVRKRDRCFIKFIPAELLAFSREPTIQCRLMKYRPIKCAVIIYGYDADGYKGKGQIFADVKTQPDVLK